jgi:hypothetical protein
MDIGSLQDPVNISMKSEGILGVKVSWLYNSEVTPTCPSAGKAIHPVTCMSRIHCLAFTTAACIHTGMAVKGCGTGLVKDRKMETQHWFSAIQLL